MPALTVAVAGWNMLAGLGLPRQYVVQIYRANALTEANAVNTAMAAGNMAAADAAFANLVRALGAPAPMLKQAFMRAHAGALMPALGPALTDPAFAADAATGQRGETFINQLGPTGSRNNAETQPARMPPKQASRPPTCAPSRRRSPISAPPPAR